MCFATSILNADEKETPSLIITPQTGDIQIFEPIQQVANPLFSGYKGNSSVHINGYLQLKAYNYPNSYYSSNNTLSINRSELAVTWKPDTNINCLVSTGSDEMLSEKKIVWKDLKIDFELSPLVILSIGGYKSPFSYELLNSEKNLDFIDYSESVLPFAPRRMVGIQASGRTGFFGYAFKISNSSFYSSNNNYKYFNIRVIFDITEWLHIANSEYYEFDIYSDSASISRISSAGELILNFEPLVFKCEYLHGYPQKNDYYQSNLYGYAEGWYGQLGYKLFENYELLLKWDHLWGHTYTDGSKYSSSINGGNYEEKLIIKDKYIMGMNYYLNQNLKLQFNWEYIPVNPNERHKFIFQLQTDFDLKI